MVDFSDNNSLINSGFFHEEQIKKEIIYIIEKLSEEDLYYILEILKSTIRT